VHDDQAGVKPSLAISVRSRALPDAASQKFLVSRFSNMSKRAAEFLEEWVGENPVRPVVGAPEGDDSEARLRAEECLSAAKEEDIAKDDIEEEVGDLVDYMSGVIARLVKRPESAPHIKTDDDREQRIRTKAFYIWLDEGCPEGRADAHWDMASELVAIEDNQLLTVKSVESAASLAPTGEPIERLAATENTGELPILTDQGEESAYPRQRREPANEGQKEQPTPRSRRKSRPPDSPH
jgi:hypothetical protein